MLDIKSFSDPALLPSELHSELINNLPLRYTTLPRTYYTLYFNQKLIGWAQIFFHNENEHELTHINIRQPNRNQGLGTKFINYLFYNYPSEQLIITTIIPDYFSKLGFKRLSRLPSFVDYSDYDCQHCEPQRCTPMLIKKPVYLKKFGECSICQAKYQKLVKESKPMICEYSFANNHMWDIAENPYYIDLDDQLFMVLFPFEGEQYGVVLPYPQIKQATLDKFVLKLKELNIHKLKNITDVTLQRNQYLNKYVRIEARNNWDYLYKVSDFAGYSGSAYEKKRNRQKKFTKNYPLHQIIEISNDDGIDELLTFAKRICSTDQGLPDIYSTSIIEKGLQEGLLQGLIVKIKNQIAGTILYSELNPKTIVIHFELIDSGHDGLSAYLNRLLGQELQGKYIYINREQDLGLDGLRRSKLSYRPYRLLKKYELLI